MVRKNGEKLILYQNINQISEKSLKGWGSGAPNPSNADYLEVK